MELSQNEDQESAKSLNKSVKKREETTEVKLKEETPEVESASKVFLSELECTTAAVTSDEEEENFSIRSGSFTPSDLEVSRKISSLPDEEVLARSSSPSHQEVSR